MNCRKILKIEGDIINLQRRTSDLVLLRVRSVGAIKPRGNWALGRFGALKRELIRLQ